MRVTTGEFLGFILLPYTPGSRRQRSPPVWNPNRQRQRNQRKPAFCGQRVRRGSPTETQCGVTVMFHILGQEAAWSASNCQQQDPQPSEVLSTTISGQQFKCNLILIWNHGVQEVAQHFSSAEKKKVVNPKSYIQIILQKWREMKAFSNEGKLKKLLITDYL